MPPSPQDTAALLRLFAGRYAPHVTDEELAAFLQHEGVAVPGGGVGGGWPFQGGMTKLPQLALTFGHECLWVQRRCPPRGRGARAGVSEVHDQA